MVSSEPPIPIPHPSGLPPGSHPAPSCRVRVWVPTHRQSSASPTRLSTAPCSCIQGGPGEVQPPMGTVWGGGLCSAGPGETVQRHPAWLALGMWGCPHCSLTAEFCIGAGVPHRAPQLGAVSWAPSHTPSLPPHLAWHCPTPPTPACSRTIFQMDVSILLLVIKARGQRCLAQLCTEGDGHSPDHPASLPRAAASPMHTVGRRRAAAHTLPSQAGSRCCVPLKSLFLLECP